MFYQISNLRKDEVKEFHQVFSEVLSSQFPGYTPKVIKYLLEKIYTESSFYYWLVNNSKTVLISKSNDLIIGFAVIDEPYGGVSFMRWLGIKPEFHRQGIGTSLINKWIEIARLQGCHKIEVAAQPEAKEFYKKAGLDLEGKRIKSYFGIDQFVYGKVIGNPSDEVMTR